MRRFHFIVPEFRFRHLLPPAALLLGPSCWQMHEQMSVRPHESPAMEPPLASVSYEGVPVPRTREEAATLVNPIAYDTLAGAERDEIVRAGHLAYRRYCWACHGPALDGQSHVGADIATVGPSLPHLQLSLLDPEVQAQPDGELFYDIYYWSDRPRYSCPPLGATMTSPEIWQAVTYLRAVAATGGPIGELPEYRVGARPVGDARLDLYRTGVPATQ